jgi:hypothetical protein
MLGPLVCIILLLAAAAVALVGANRAERQLIVIGLIAHMLASVGVVIYHEHIYQGDLLVYAEIGRDIARLVEQDRRYFVDVVRLAFHLDNDLAIPYFDGSSSGTMCAFAALLILAVGDNLYLICLTVSLFAFVGLVSMYRAAAPHLHSVERKPFLASLMVVPSVVFWTSGLIKEAFVVGFLGLACRGLAGIARRRLTAIFLLVPAIIGIGVTKSYVLIALTFGVTGWLYARRPIKFGMASKILAAVVGVAGILLVMRAFPEYGSGLAASVSRQQVNFAQVQGGTDTALGNDEDADMSLAGQLRFLPLALVNAFARPFLFDAHNAASLVAAVEITVVLVLIGSLFRHGARRILGEVRQRPPLMFAALFVLSFSVGVGLTTRNLGSLSRYRVPAFPLYVALAVALRARLTAPRMERVDRKAGRPLGSVRRRAA